MKKDVPDRFIRLMRKVNQNIFKIAPGSLKNQKKMTVFTIAPQS